MAADEEEFSTPTLNDALKDIQSTLHSIQHDYRGLASSLEAIEGRVNIIAGVREVGAATTHLQSTIDAESAPLNADKIQSTPASIAGYTSAHDTTEEIKLPTSNRASGNPSRIILTTYPGQAGINPIHMDWGQQDPTLRGPVVVSRSQSTIRRRNGMRLVSLYSVNLSYIPYCGSQIRCFTL